MLIPMRRWFAILLLVFLPLQSLWAAAAPYCAHEETPESMHLGHHAHEHHETQPEPDSSDGLGAAHTDCHVCHGGGVVVQTPFLAFGQDPRFGLTRLWAETLLSQPYPVPDRPNWARLA